MDYLPSQFQELNSLPLIGGILWIALILIISLTLLFIGPLKRIYWGSKETDSDLSEKKSKAKGF